MLVAHQKVPQIHKMSMGNSELLLRLKRMFGYGWGWSSKKPQNIFGVGGTANQSQRPRFVLIGHFVVKHSLIPNRQVRAKKATKVTPMTFLLRIAAGNALILLGSSRQQLSLRIFNAD